VLGAVEAVKSSSPMLEVAANAVVGSSVSSMQTIKAAITPRFIRFAFILFLLIWKIFLNSAAAPLRPKRRGGTPKAAHGPQRESAAKFHV
jgi:hypothetical protein